MEGRLLEGTERDLYAMYLGGLKDGAALEPFERNESFHISEYAYRIPEDPDVIITEMCTADDCDLYLYTLEEWNEYKKPWSAKFAEIRQEIISKASQGDEACKKLVDTWYPKVSGADLISNERQRQISEEGWDKAHDSEHNCGELIEAAVAYLGRSLADNKLEAYWPWAAEWWKPSDNIKNLTKAGALIAAEIDRLQNEGHGKEEASS